MGSRRTLIAGDWVHLEQLINELYSLVVTEETSLTVILSDILAIHSDLVITDAELDAVSDIVVVNASDIDVLEAEMGEIHGTIEDVDVLPDPVVIGKVVRLTTNEELYIGKTR